MFHQGAGAQGTATVATGFTHKGPLGQGHCLFSPQRASTGTEVGVTQLEAGACEEQEGGAVRPHPAWLGLKGGAPTEANTIPCPLDPKRFLSRSPVCQFDTCLQPPPGDPVFFLEEGEVPGQGNDRRTKAGPSQQITGLLASVLLPQEAEPTLLPSQPP